MILLDYQQVILANMYQSLGKHLNAEINEDILRHMVLNSIRSYNSKHRDEYGEMVICTDGTSSWRKKVFSYYKANRKKTRDASELDWNMIFTSFRKIREEIEEYFPYKVIHHPNIEADDIIAVLAERFGKFGSNQKVLIVSSDKDFVQLHKHSNVFQIHPVSKEYIRHASPETFLIEHIIRGDSSDGIPNILSGDDFLVNGIRQKMVTKKRLDELTELIVSGEITNTEHAKNYERNKQLVDLEMIPEDLKNFINSKYDSSESKDKSRILTYFINNRLKMLTSHISDF